MISLEWVPGVVEKFKRFNSWLLYIVIAALMASFLVDSLNPLVIKLLGFGLFPFQKELVEELLVIIVWLPFAYVLLGPGHIVTDMFRNRMGQRSGFVADMIVGAAVLVAGLVAFSASLGGTLHAIRFRSIKMGEVQFSLIPFYVTISVSFFLFVIADILWMLQRVFRFKQGEPGSRGKTPDIKEGPS